MELNVEVHKEEGSYWAEVAELPGCFATGDSLDELVQSLEDGVALYLRDEATGATPAVTVSRVGLHASESQPA